jgi:hypothetical protein
MNTLLHPKHRAEDAVNFLIFEIEKYASSFKT